MDGSIFMYRVDTNEASKVTPIYSLKKSKEQKILDFETLNNETVLATTSLKPKHIWIYDTLVSSRSGLVMENSALGGNII